MRKTIATCMSLILMLTLLMGVFSVSAEEPPLVQVIYDDYFNFSSATVGDGINVGGTNYLTLNINSTAAVERARLRIYSVRYIPPYNSCNMPMGRYIPDGTTRLSHEIGNFFDLYQAIPHLAANVRVNLAEGANSLTVRLNQILTHNMPTTIEIELPEGALATVSLDGAPVATKVIPGIDWEMLDSITPNPTGPNNLLPVVPESLRARADCPEFSLWREYEDFFQIGNINGSFGTVWARRHYNTWTAENAHKPDHVMNAAGDWNFILNPNHASNTTMRNAMSIDAEVVGHVLVWHGQSRNAFHPGVGATRAQSIAALEHHIRHVVEYFDTFVFPEDSPRAGERVMAAWDVVNEAFINEIPYVSEESLNTPGSWKNYLRKVTQPIRGWNNAPGAGTGTVGYAYRYHWYEGFGNGANAELGESGADFIYYAFVIARRYTDAQLIYNDFNLYEEGKAQMVAQMVNELNARYAYEQPNGPDDRKLIEAVGMQGHWYIQDTPVRDPQRGVQRGIDILRETGVRIHITELDLFVYYPYSGSGAGSHGSHTRLKNRTGVQLENPARPYYDHYYWRDRFGLSRDEMPPAGFGKFMEAAQAEMYAEIFATLKANADVIDRVTFWGLRDTNSWRQSHAPLLWYADSPAGVPNPKLSYYAVAFPEEFLGIDPIPTPAQRDDFLQYIEDAVAYLESLDPSDYTRDSWAAVLAAIEEAREVHEYRWNGVPTLLAAAEAITDALAGLTEGYTLTFNLYTTSQLILDTFADYTTVVNGRAKIVVPVVPGTAPTLGEVLNLGHIYGTADRHGYAFWGWFDDEALDASGRMRAGLRRPALTVPSEEDICRLANILGQIEADTAIYENGNINLYGVWVRWGDVDDNGAVNMADLNILQRHINLSHVAPTSLSIAAADVVVDGQVNMVDLNLLQRHANLGHIMPVVLGAEPQP